MAEIAKLIPGHHKRIDNGEGGTSYIDDFERVKFYRYKKCQIVHLTSIPQDKIIFLKM